MDSSGSLPRAFECIVVTALEGHLSGNYGVQVSQAAQG